MGQYYFSINLKNEKKEITKIKFNINDPLGDLFFNWHDDLPLNFKAEDLRERHPNEPIFYHTKSSVAVEEEGAYIKPVYSLPDDVLRLHKRFYPFAKRNLREYCSSREDSVKHDEHDYSIQLFKGLEQIRTVALVAKATNQTMALMVEWG